MQRFPGEAEVVIVGAGAAGSLIAAELADAGRSVLVLEAGPAWTLGDLASSQIWARRLKWRGPPVMLGGENPIAHNMTMGSGLGGAALHHYGTWPRFTPDVFRIASDHGRGFDWPFDYDELAPYYDRVQGFVGLSGDTATETWRPRGEPYPMPPMKSFRHAEILRDGFRRLGLPVAPLPACINSIPYAGRAPCLYDGWCDAGCPIGALGNPFFTYQALARERGARFVTHARVTRVTFDDAGRPRGVEYVVGDDEGSGGGDVRRVYAAVIVLAASVVENPRILLNSHHAKHPRGLGNGTGQVGRHVMAEIMSFVYGLFEGPVDNHLGVSAGSFMHRAPVRHPGLPGIVAGHQWQIGPAVKPNDIFGIAVTRPDLFGAPLDDFIRRASRELAYMVGFGGGVADENNAITLDSKRDAHGVPLARVTHRFTGEQRRLWQFMLDQGRAVMGAAHAREIWTGPMAAGHLIGGTIMGRDPATSVTDSYGALHDAPNVIVTGAGLFPSCGGQSPTFTLHAVSLRTTDRLRDHWPAAASR